jgi:isoquinoline 1-oxidoreductase alpha subunit
LRVAAELGYEVTVVKDAAADYSTDQMHAALDVNIPNYASGVVTTDELVDSISSLSPELVMITLKINGKSHSIDVPSDMPVLWVLRDVLGMTGTKFGCGMALCGACTVQLDGQAIRSCVTPVSAAAGKAITTIEAIGATPVGKKVQQAWIALDVPQCGYCQSGQIMSASALLARNASPTDADIDAAMAGNICRCGTYGRVRAAIKRVAQGVSISGKGARS